MILLPSGKADKVHYKRNLQIALILSLLILIIAFAFFPHINNNKEPEYYFAEPIITVSDIPSTEQSGQPPSIPPKPVLIIPSDLEEIEYTEFLDEVKIPSREPGTKSKASEGESKVYQFSSLPFIPRQIREVVPGEIDGAAGTIKLSLKIDNNGYVTEHKVLFNSANREECLRNVIQAVYKSRWQPITIDGEKIEYWLEKSYQFN